MQLKSKNILNKGKLITNNFIPPYPLKTPVLFLIFNRIDTTKQVFAEIRKAKPPKLYIAADGARENVIGEKKKVDKVRKYVLDNIDWDCEVRTLFREKNLGCKYAVSGAIDWFFENEEMGIILEDDTVPSQSFFWFCEELLERYNDDTRIWHIGGYKHPKLFSDGYSYVFSRFVNIWGWATWKRAWKKYDVNLTNYKVLKEKLENYELFPDISMIKARKHILDKVVKGEIDTWDYQWSFCVRINNGLVIRPNINLISNIGFGAGGTHTTKVNKLTLKNKKQEIEFPLKHPDFVMINLKIDNDFIRRYFMSQSLINRVINFIFHKVFRQ